MVWDAIAGAGIGLIGNLAGGIFGSSSASAANAANMAIAREQMNMQREFAQQGLSWRVQDAIRSNVHPLYALGFQGPSPTPVSAGQQPTDYSFMGRMGQDIGRAVQATMTAKDRVADAMLRTEQALRLNNMGLQNELLAAQIRRANGQIGPPMPALGSRSPGGVLSGDAQASVWGPHEMKPPEVSSPMPGYRSVEAGPVRPQAQWGWLPDGRGVQPFPAKLPGLEDDGMLQAEWYLRNRLNPWLHQERSSSRAGLPHDKIWPGSTGAYWDENKGGWYPLYAGEYPPDRYNPGSWLRRQVRSIPRADTRRPSHTYGRGY